MAPRATLSPLSAHSKIFYPLKLPTPCKSLLGKKTLPLAMIHGGASRHSICLQLQISSSSSSSHMPATRSIASIPRVQIQTQGSHPPVCIPPSRLSQSSSCRSSITRASSLLPRSRSITAASLTALHNNRPYSCLSRPATSSRIVSPCAHQSAARHKRSLSSTSVAMTATKIDGTAIAKGIRQKLHEEIESRQKSNPRYKPSLKIIQGM